jgi:hypothetical protein
LERGEVNNDDVGKLAFDLLPEATRMTGDEKSTGRYSIEQRFWGARRILTLSPMNRQGNRRHANSVPNTILQNRRSPVALATGKGP